MPRKVKPGLTAPAWEKQLFKLINGTPDAAVIYAVGQQYPTAAPTAAMVEMLRVVGPNKDGDRAPPCGWLFDTGYDPSADPVINKYMERPEISIPVATVVTAEMLWDRQATGLFVAEVEQAFGNFDRAIAVVEKPRAYDSRRGVARRTLRGDVALDRHRRHHQRSCRSRSRFVEMRLGKTQGE